MYIIGHNRQQQKWEGCAFFIFFLCIVCGSRWIWDWYLVPICVKIKIIIRIIIDSVSFYFFIFIFVIIMYHFFGGFVLE